MEFLELLLSAQEFIPPQYASVSRAIDMAYPYFYLAISAVICFFGLKVHHIWLSFFFFMVGFFGGALCGLFFPKTWSIYIFITFGVVLGVVLARSTHKLHKLQLFISAERKHATRLTNSISHKAMRHNRPIHKFGMGRFRLPVSDLFLPHP